MLFFYFYFIYFFILQERAAGVGCFSHVWPLLSKAMLFSAVQRGWLHARENERGERNKDRIKTERALTQRLLSLTHFCENQWVCIISTQRQADFEINLCSVVI